MSEITFEDLKRIPRSTTDVIVLKIDRPWSVALVADAAEQLRRVFPATDANPHPVILLGPAMQLETLNDEQLAQLGLKRLDPHEAGWRKAVGDV